MEIVNGISDTKPIELVSGPTVTLYRCNVTCESAEDDNGVTRTTYLYTEYRFKPGEYERMLEGILPAGASWDENLHEKYRNTLHRKTDDLYSEAYRCRRVATDDAATAWDEYITALDNWNAKVSAMAKKMTTKVPELPTKPTA